MGCSQEQSNGKKLIRYVDVYKSFKSKVVLKGANLDVRGGEVLVIIGGSGTGKSVILKLLTGLLDPDSGDIFFGEDNIVEKTEDELLEIRKKIGMLFQSGALFDSLSVYENIAYPLREHTNIPESEIREKIKEKLSLVGLTNVEHLYPAELSGGMRKRVSLARSIVFEPCLILYDEPTTGLDPSTSNMINELIINLQKKLNVTSIVVTHDMNTVRIVADRIAMLYKGEIIIEGLAAEVLSSENEIVRDFITGNISHAT
ncbi:ABC transporter ATP-binding protein [bacterium]|nr:ABC transporter ATP-binding protein [bacterium]